LRGYNKSQRISFVYLLDSYNLAQRLSDFLSGSKNLLKSSKLKVTQSNIKPKANKLRERTSTILNPKILMPTLKWRDKSLLNVNPQELFYFPIFCTKKNKPRYEGLAQCELPLLLACLLILLWNWTGMLLVFAYACNLRSNLVFKPTEPPVETHQVIFNRSSYCLMF